MNRNSVFSILILLLAAMPLSAEIIQQQEIYKARDKVLPALVHIQPVIKNYNTGELEKQAVIGSGVIFHKDGYVVTNYHVAGKAERIICTLNDKELVPAEYIGGDPLTDVAIIKLQLDDYHGEINIAEFGDSDSLQVGQFVLAMGSPLSLSRSVSAGVISTRDRFFGDEVRLPSGERTGIYNLWIQTDAAINPGNSGGPLVDLNGRVIGINSRATMFANNLGFAIPVNIVKEVTSAILDHGSVIRSWIGVHCQALQEMEQFFKTGRDKGVLVSSIDPGSPAEVSFLKTGDVILAIDDKPVSARFLEELPAFYKTIAEYKPGSEINMKVLRGEEEYTLKVKTRQLGDLQGEDFEVSRWDFTIKEITSQMKIENNLNDTIGVFVTGVKRNGAADTGGMRPRDIIKKINDTNLLNLADFIAAYNMIDDDLNKKILLTVDRNRSTRFILLKLDRAAKENIDE